MKVSWLVLTYNRDTKVDKAIRHNIENAGSDWHEMVWVDNGSSDGVRDVMSSFKPKTSILFDENKGVAIGYNTAMVNARGDYLCITGCDMLMPKDWLKTFKEYFEKVDKTGIAAMYSGPLSWVPERIRGDEATIEGMRIRPAMPIGRRMYSRELLGRIGYLREDFGLYGWEDVEWGFRAERVCRELGLLTYVIPDQIAQHLGTEGIHTFDGKDESAYHAFKAEEVKCKTKLQLMEWCRANDYPYYNPYR